MGCWNETCGITQLPIRHGDPVVLFLLVKVPSYEGRSAGHCHSTDIWSPYSIQIHGKYNDYGSLEKYDTTNWNIEYIVDQLKKDAIPMEVGENEYHDLAVEPDKFTFKKILELIHESRLFVPLQVRLPEIKETQLPIGFMFVHEFIFNAMCNFTYNTFRGDITFDRIIDDANKRCEWFRAEKLKYLASNNINKKNDFEFRIFLDRLKLNIRDDFSNQFSILESYNNVFVRGYGAKRYLNDLFDLVIDEINDDLIKERIIDLAKFRMFTVGVEFTRKTFSPQGGKGSQSEEHEIYKSLLQISLDHINNRMDEDEAY